MEEGWREVFRSSELPTLVTAPPTAVEITAKIEMYCYIEHFLATFKCLSYVVCNIICPPHQIRASGRKEGGGAGFLSG